MAQVLAPGVWLGQPWRPMCLGVAQPPSGNRRLGRYPSTLLSLLELIIFGFGTAFINSFH